MFRLGPKGRKALVDSWAQFLPLYTQTETINQQAVTSPATNHVNSTPGITINSAEQTVSILLFFVVFCPLI